MPTYISEDQGGLPVAAQPGGRLPAAEDLIKYARADAAEIGIDPDIAERRIRQESRGRADAVSEKGAFGAAQLMPATAAELARKYGGDPRNPIDNVRLGNRYYKEQLDKYGNDTLAAAAYNAGPGAVDKHGGVPPFAETQDYVRKVVARGVAPEGTSKGHRRGATSSPTGTRPGSGRCRSRSGSRVRNRRLQELPLRSAAR